MRGGFLQQVAAPQELYDRPANLFVAEFIGSPAMNLVRRSSPSERRRRRAFGDQRSPCRDRCARRGRASPPTRASRSSLGIRPEDIEDAALARNGRRPVDVEVDIREDMGSEVFAHFASTPSRSRRTRCSRRWRRRTSRRRVRERMRPRRPFIARLDRETAREGGRALELASTPRGSTSSTPRPGPGSTSKAKADARGEQPRLGDCRRPRLSRSCVPWPDDGTTINCFRLEAEAASSFRMSPMNAVSRLPTPKNDGAVTRPSSSPGVHRRELSRRREDDHARERLARDQRRRGHRRRAARRRAADQHALDAVPQQLRSAPRTSRSR